ncbi:hypothetical protein PMI01_00099 [Caulobacter sp. AP07]|nr:hypothetical protein PMI01_00099 [Caulobacter sp. AP07]
MLVAAVGLHAAVLTLLAWPVVARFPDRSTDEGAIDVTLERPRRATGGAWSSGPARLSPRPRAPRQTPTAEAVAALPIAPVSTMAAPGPAPGAANGDLGAALRRSGVGCANARAVGLNREERDRCAETLGAQARDAPFLPAPIDPGKRAYYDAVAQAYDNGGPMVPLTARGAAGMFAADASANSGHGPRVGCSVKFGPNARKAPKGPPNALRAGPCFIQPPNGSLTPEADLRKPY